MKAVVTGAAGFIGANVASRLLDDGHEVVGIDTLNDAYDVRLKRWRLAQLAERKGFHFDVLDVTRLADVAPWFERERFDVVFHLAARAGVRQSLVDPWTYLDTNANGTLNILELARKRDVPRVVLASTSSLYGNRSAGAFSETDDTDRPLSPYAASKKAAESMAAAYAHLYGTHTPVLRYFTVYGPAGRPDMSPFRFIRWIAEGEPIVLYGDGSRRRDFTYVDDIARGTIAAATLKGYTIVNLGGDRPVTMSRLIEIIEASVGKSAILDRRPEHAADAIATWADIRRARSLLGWEPRTSLEEGIARTVEWYLQNREWAKQLDLGEL